MAKIAMIVGSDYEDVEFRQPYERLRAAGHEVEVLGKRAGETVAGKRGKDRVAIEASCAERDPASYDALVIPGGYGPDRLRTDERVVDFVRRFVATGKPVAAVCHGPQLLIEADVVRGRTVTSWPSVRTDLRNAGADWVDREVVEDGTLITSRKPDDLGAFTTAIERHLG